MLSRNCDRRGADAAACVVVVDCLTLLASLPRLPVAEHEEVLALVESRRLAGTGIGWVDAHLLASALMAGRALGIPGR